MRIAEKIIEGWSKLRKRGDSKLIAQESGGTITQRQVNNAFSPGFADQDVIEAIHKFYNRVKDERLASQKKMKKLESQYT